MSFGLKVLIRNLIGQLSASIDIVILGKLASQGFLGAYTFSKQITNLPFEKIIRIINQVLMPYLSKFKDDKISMRDWTIKVADLQLLIIAPFFYLVYFSADEIVALLLGSEWLMAVFPLKIFCIANIFKLTESYVSVALTALGKVNEQILFAFIQLILIGGMILIIGITVNVNSSLYVWITLYPILCIYFCHILLNSIGLGFLRIFLRVKTTLAAQLIMVFTLFLIDYSIVESTWQTLIVKFVTGILVYLIGLRIIDRSKIRLLFSIFPRANLIRS